MRVLVGYARAVTRLGPPDAVCRRVSRKRCRLQALHPSPSPWYTPFQVKDISIGYHAKAGTPDSLLEHTSSGSVTDFSINGISMPEAGYNALIAGTYNVPVLFAAGDRTLCDQIKTLLGEVETVPVKEGIGAAAVSLHPEVTRERIRAGVEKALHRLDDFEPYRLEAPYTLVVKLKSEETVNKGSHYPGVKRTGEWELTYSSDDFLEIMLAFSYVRR